MKLVLIADTFPPLRTSGAVQLRDLARELAKQGHDVVVMLPAPGQPEAWRLEYRDGVRVLRLRAPKTKDIGYVRRTLAEWATPFFMRWHLRGCPIRMHELEGVVWYSPSIFLAPLARALKVKSRCPSYLIIRDIFPEWAVDMGLMRRGLAYRFFDAVARYQYAVADVIGVQTPGNRTYFETWQQGGGRRLEVLQNWLDQPAASRCSIRIAETHLAGRKILVYAGNMGIAQGMSTVLQLAERLTHRHDLGFLFVGRGSEAQQLQATAKDRKLANVLFCDEIDPDEIPDLYAQCDAGIVALDARHRSHNIPGKFITYMQSGLPTLAVVNAGNDMAEVIRRERVGQVCESHWVDELVTLTETLLKQIESDGQISQRCRDLFQREFAVNIAARQVVDAMRVRPPVSSDAL